MEKEEKKEDVATEPKLRQIIIETDGNNVKIVKAEVNGNIELIGILNTIISHFDSQK